MSAALRAVAAVLLLSPVPALAQDAAVTEEDYVTILSMNDCSMTEAALAADLPKLGMDPASLVPVTEDLVARGAATVTDEADGNRRITLGPEICTPVDMAEYGFDAPPEHVAKVTEVLLARNCLLQIADGSAAEAEAGLTTSEFSMAFAVLQSRGEGEIDPVKMELRLINKDCP